MRHVFRATKLGRESEQEGIWFDADQYTKEEAEAQFIPVERVSQKGYFYTAYEYDGQLYHDIYYAGCYEDNGMPRNNDDMIDHLIKNGK